jgi:RNA polymerase sigma factor (sigma-70 family)
MKQQRSIIRLEEGITKTQISLLYQQHAEKMLKYISIKISSVQDAEDILIDTFVAALESELFASLSSDEQQRWLWRVIRNKVVDRYRKSKITTSLDLADVDDMLTDDPVWEPELISIRQEEDDHLALLLKRLSPLQQRVLYLRFGENLRCSQIAAIVGKRDGSIRALLSRTFHLLRSTYYAQEEGDHHETGR